MPNRVIKDSIWTSPTLSNLAKFEHCLAFPWWILQADDWGCFEVDIDVVKGKVFPKRKDVTPKKVEEMRQAYQDAGLLFCWVEGDREWGYFVSFDSHHGYCNKTSVDEGGKQVRHKRKTPEPPIDLLNAYLERTCENFRAVQSGLERARAVQNKYRNPNPNPNPNPNNSIRSKNAFEEDWDNYPRKAGDKKKAFQAYEKTVGVDLEKMRPTFQAKMEAYKKSVADQDPKFIKHGETFFRNWQDIEVDLTLKSGAAKPLGETRHQQNLRVLEKYMNPEEHVDEGAIEI